MGRVYYLTTPLKKSDIEQLQIDDTVYLSGELYTFMYYNHYENVLQLLREGKPLPENMNLNGAVAYHTGTIFKRLGNGEYDFRGICATTSCKFDEKTPPLIRETGIRAVMGKGGMSKNVLETMQECGCVYLSVAGGCSAIYKEKVITVGNEYWPQKSWADNMLRLEVKDFGPCIVTMDAHGNSIYEDIGRSAELRKHEIYEYLGITE